MEDFTTRTTVSLTALALLASLATLPGAGADVTTLDTLPLEGTSFAAWKVHYAGGGTSLSFSVVGSSTISSDAGALSVMSQILPASEIGHGGGSLFVFTFDTAANNAQVSIAGLVDYDVTSYTGHGYTGIGWRSTWTETNANGIPAGDYYIVTMFGQDVGGTTGSVTLAGNDVSVVSSDHGPAFYFRESNYPAAVNVVVDQNDERLRSIELGLVEEDVTGLLFAHFFHQEFLPAPIWFPQTTGFWVEGPGIMDPVTGTGAAVEYLANDCPEDIVLFCIGPAIENNALDGQNWGQIAISGGAAGHYKFRVDQWTAPDVSPWPWWSPTPIISLIGADVQLE